ncbi:unnamed protein product [Lymnaea stagnalis]|uniref:Uncharacterized protein n=1 Tax=Lymnaea stagnalis TaxID=6523 RepID=A0AAV2I405_LYMST
MKIEDMFRYVYDNGFAGAWSWDLLGYPGEFTGIAGIRDLKTNGEIPVTIE